MKLRGINFGNVLCASGVQGWFGEGYPSHKILKPFGLNFRGTTFVSKTTTLFSRKGNMPLTRHYTPRSFIPSCIKVKFRRKLVLNSVGLSGPGLGALLGAKKWQKRTKPFFISIMSLADTPQRRLEESRIMVDMIGLCKEDFCAPFGLQINLSCPNTGRDPNKLVDESANVLETANILGVPLMLKYSIASATITAVMKLNDHPDLDAICVSNTLPFHWQGLDWKETWGSSISPLEKYGGGGLSGEVLCPLTCKWIRYSRDTGFTKPINGGGGILCKKDVESYRDAGASSVFVGSVAILRPLRVKGIIAKANELKWRTI